MAQKIKKSNPDTHERDVNKMLRVLKDAGQVVTGVKAARTEITIGRRRSKRALSILAEARKKEQEGELEFDDNARISESDDNGAYVQAWVWVDFAGTPLSKDPEETK